ncbi:MAG: hypothetical protein QG635_1389 [Bacteroidota bacterium]|nr:hypothetical protein [Bacteroidota bacterium]
MKMNHKQEELVGSFYKIVKEMYPEIELLNLSINPDDPEHIWINVKADMDEDREIEMSLFAAGIEADIDIEYGYRISVMSENPNSIYA